MLTAEGYWLEGTKEQEAGRTDNEDEGCAGDGDGGGDGGTGEAKAEEVVDEGVIVEVIEEVVVEAVDTGAAAGRRDTCSIVRPQKIRHQIPWC